MYINKNAILNTRRKTRVQHKKNIFLHTFSRHSDKASINFPPRAFPTRVLNGDSTKSVSFLTSWLKYL